MSDIKKWFDKERKENPKFAKICKEYELLHKAVKIIVGECIKRKISIAELARMSELSYNTVYNIYVCNSNPRIRTLSKIFNALNMQIYISVGDTKLFLN